MALIEPTKVVLSRQASWGLPQSQERKYIPNGSRSVSVSEASSLMQEMVLGYWTTLVANAANVSHDTIDTAEAAPRMATRSSKS